MKKLTILSIVLIISLCALGQELVKVETVSLNGKKIYYEAYGKGEPLFLLHGYTSSSKQWLPYVVDFSQEYTVYLVDLTGHGKSDPFKEKLSIRSVAEDLNALIQYLELEQIRAIGHSFGGDVLFQLALINPSILKSMITIGALGSWDAREYPDWTEFFSYKNLENLTWIEAHQTNDEQIRAMLDAQFENYIVFVNDNELKDIKTETLLILGDDDDSMPLEEVSRVRKNLPNSDLWILPNSGHSTYEGKNRKEFIRYSKVFLRGIEAANKR